MISQASNQEVFSNFRILEKDLVHVQELGAYILPEIAEIVEDFHKVVAQQESIIQIQQLKVTSAAQKASIYKWEINHWSVFWKGEFAEEYFNSRHNVGTDMAAGNLPLSEYTYSASVYLELFIQRLDKRGLMNKENWRSVRKLFNMDTNLIIEQYSNYTTSVLISHMEALKTMSFPIPQIWDHILLLPIVGRINRTHLKGMMQDILRKIEDKRAKVLIIDLLGIRDFSADNARDLMKLFKAAALMDCKVISSGITPDVARILVEVTDLDLSDLYSTTSMENALAHAFEWVKTH